MNISKVNMVCVWDSVVLIRVNMVWFLVGCVELSGENFIFIVNKFLFMGNNIYLFVKFG